MSDIVIAVILPSFSSAILIETVDPSVALFIMLRMFIKELVQCYIK